MPREAPVTRATLPASAPAKLGCVLGCRDNRVDRDISSDVVAIEGKVVSRRVQPVELVDLLEQVGAVLVRRSDVLQGQLHIDVLLSSQPGGADILRAEDQYL